MTKVWAQIPVALQNISCFVFEQRMVFLNAAVQNIYNVFYFKLSSMCIFKAVKKQSGFGFIVDALFDNFAYLHSLFTVVELHTNFVLIHFERQLKTTSPDGCFQILYPSWWRMCGENSGGQIKYKPSKYE